MGVAGHAHGERGQMTVEMAIAMPVLIAVALLAVNALLYVGDCAAFDRLSRQAVCVYATSPPYGKTTLASAGDVEAELRRSFSADNQEVNVNAEQCAGGYVRFSATLKFAPTLFGRSFSGQVFGVELPSVSHTATVTVDPYRPGVIV